MAYNPEGIVKAEERGQVLVVTPQMDRLDALVANDFRKALIDAVSNRNCVILNLENVAFVDSSGLGSLIGAFKSMPPGAQLLLACVGKSVMTLLRMTHLDQVLLICDTVEMALEKAS